MLAIRIILFICPGLLVGHQSLTEAAGLTRLHEREARPATIIAADGELLTVVSAPTTTLSPPNALQAPASSDATKVPSLFDGEAPPPQPDITPAPGPEELAIKYKQTTYYTCVTIGTYSHCGIHEPILDAGAGRSKSGRGNEACWAVLAATLTVLGLALGA